MARLEARTVKHGGEICVSAVTVIDDDARGVVDRTSPPMTMPPARKPFPSYPGGKDAAGCAERTLFHLPAHSVFVDAFLGGGAILRRKAPALRSIGIDKDPKVIDAWRRCKWPGLELVQGCAIRWLEKHGHTLPADALVYADPPYLHSTRSHRRIYRCELSTADHRRLLRVLRDLPCSVVLAGYESEMYRDALSDWTFDTFQSMTRGGTRMECLWVRCSTAARDGAAGVTGRDYRERERIKRKAQRWVDNFDRLPAHERSAILARLLDAERRKLKI